MTESLPFVPLKGGKNPHIQTLLPRFLRRKAVFEPVWERLATPDGDFLDISWTEPPSQASNKPVVVLFHGLQAVFTARMPMDCLMLLNSRDGWAY